MKKALIAGLLGAATLLSGQLHASNDCCWDPCCGWDGCFEIGAAALYWKPCHCPYEYGALSTSTGNAGTLERILSVKPDYEWGFRIWAGYRSECDCWFATLGWTYLRATDSSKIRPGFGQTLFVNTAGPAGPTATNASEVIAKIRNEYNKVNLRGGYYLHRGCNINFYTYAGIRYIDIEHLERTTYQSLESGQVGEGRTRLKAEFSGGALELGVGFDYHIGCGFNLAGYFGGLAALGKQKLRYQVDNPTTPTTPIIIDADYHYRSFTHCLPGTEFKLGINYAYDCACVTLVGEIGYEIDYYFNLLNRRVTGTDFTDCENIGFAGPYASLSLCF